tara:strand:+ start:1931 stop:2074 length:144 start_codon:yes stop_codon:yes gene_type:complete
MDKLQVESAIGSLSKALEDVTYKLYTLEDAVAKINAYMEDKKEREHA